jgi:hypothetical protein
VNACDPDPEAVPSPVRAVIPLPLEVGTEQLTLDPLTAHVQFVFPLGAAGVVPFRFGLLTDAPLTLIDPLPPEPFDAAFIWPAALIVIFGFV